MYSQLIEEANLKFNNKFTYIEPEKFLSKKKVEIVCPVHR